MKAISCPKCESPQIIKSGIVKERQRYSCKNCRYNFTVSKPGKGIDPYFVTKALQLYIEGVSYREIERLLGISHVSVMNWVRKYKVKAPENSEYRPTYKIFTYQEMLEFMRNRERLKGSGMLITEIGDKYMMIKWERFRS